MSDRIVGLTRRGLAALLVGLCPLAPAIAGPPYETDDPAPTDTGHWEVYVFSSIEGRGNDVAGAAGVDLNYGPVQGVQLTATLPVEFAHDKVDGWNSGFGDVELGVKYRFLNAASCDFSMAVFPRVILPTSPMPGAGNKARILLPMWAQKDLGKTSLFGGGGYEINPGSGNRDFWLAGAAITHELSDRLSLGGEVTHQSAGSVDGDRSTSLGIGSIVKLHKPFSLLLSGGPTWSGGDTSYHLYVALGLGW